MGVKPTLYEIIGVEVKSEEKEKVREKFNKMINGCDELTVFDCSFNIITEVSKNEEDYEFLCEVAEEALLVDFLNIIEIEEKMFLGLKEIFTGEDTELIGHSLLYTMIEGSILNGERMIKKIPYKRIKEDNVSLLEEIQIQNHTNKWDRRYPNHRIGWYDQSLDYSCKFIKQHFIEGVDKNRIQRYLVFEWS